MLKQRIYFSLLVIVTCLVLPLQGEKSAVKEAGELKLKLIQFQGKKSHTLQIKLDWGEGKSLGDNTWVARVKGEGNDSLGGFNYVATRIANPEWTEYNLWINYSDGKYKDRSLRLSWVTHGHEPPDNIEVADGVWVFRSKAGKVTGSAR
ncbi:MAG: hypothetical protein J0L53_00335 [Spirochaetes bacterium]|nr:hypothetical protein [Spirochaetota bacterium]